MHQKMEATTILVCNCQILEIAYSECQTQWNDKIQASLSWVLHEEACVGHCKIWKAGLGGWISGKWVDQPLAWSRKDLLKVFLWNRKSIGLWMTDLDRQICCPSGLVFSTYWWYLARISGLGIFSPAERCWKGLNLDPFGCKIGNLQLSETSGNCNYST